MLFFGVTFKFLLDKLTSAQRNDSFILHHFYHLFIYFNEMVFIILLLLY